MTDRATRWGIEPGLCGGCRHGEWLTSRTSAYLRCGRSASDAGLPRYPLLPIRSCHGFEQRESLVPINEVSR